MKLLFLSISIACFAFSSTAQYRDSLKTFRKLTKTYQKSSDFVFIPAGAYSAGMDDTDFILPDSYYLSSKVMSVDSFFMGKFEISNENYLEFVNDKLKEDRILGKTFLPDTLVWRTKLGFGEKYVDYYFRHPAYRNYPVVGVSYTQAKAYAEWRTAQYNANEDRVFKKVQFRLPTEQEWEFAYRGGQHYLPWGSSSTIDENGKLRANFRAISQLSVYRDSVVVNHYGETKKRPVYLSTGDLMQLSSIDAMEFYANEFATPVDAFEPNKYGLYNMAGNLEEMVDAYYFRDPSFFQFSHDLLPKSDKPWGVTKGGSWNDTGYYLLCPVRQFYDDPNSSSNEIGFRLVMEVLEY